MTFDDFISKWTGKTVDFDGIYPNQCMDLMHQYVYDVLGLTDARLLAHPAAYQVFTDFTESQYFDKIANTPDGVPQKGDIVLFNKTSSNPYGHVCIFISGDTNKFKSFDANYPTGSLPHVQDHTYGYCLGWLRPKATTPDLQAQVDQLRQERDTNWNMFTRLCDALQTQHNVDIAVGEIEKLIKVEDTLIGTEKQLTENKTKIETLESKISELTKVNEKLVEDNGSLKELVKTQEQTILEQGINITSLGEQIQDLKEASNLPPLSGWRLQLSLSISKILASL